jgi:hypothetical protein
MPPHRSTARGSGTERHRRTFTRGPYVAWSGARHAAAVAKARKSVLFCMRSRWAITRSCLAHLTRINAEGSRIAPLIWINQA